MFLCVKNKKIVIGMLVWASYFVATGCVVSAQKMDTHVDEKVKAKLPLHVEKMIEKEPDKLGKMVQYYLYSEPWSLGIIMIVVYLGLLCCPSIAILMVGCLGYDRKRLGGSSKWFQKKMIGNEYVRIVVGVACCALIGIGFVLSYSEYKKLANPGAFVLTNDGFLVCKPGAGDKSIWVRYEEIVRLEEKQGRDDAYKSFQLKDRSDHIYEYGFSDMVSEKEWEELYGYLKKKVEAAGGEVKK